jgi:hypothetical protein
MPETATPEVSATKKERAEAAPAKKSKPLNSFDIAQAQFDKVALSPA